MEWHQPEDFVEPEPGNFPPPAGETARAEPARPKIAAAA